MLKRVVCSVTALCLIVCTVFCYAAENEKSVKIDLKGNPTTGYIWAVRNFDETIISVSDYDYIQDNIDKNISGAGGTFIFTVSGLKEGVTHIIFDYLRPWEGNHGIINTVDYDVSVLADGNVKLYNRQDNISIPVKGISVIADNKEVSFDVAPFIEDDRVLVPIRAILETLGANVSYDEENNSVICRKRDTHILLPVGEKTIFVNMVPIELDTYARIINDRTFVPLRAISEAMGAKVDWNDETDTVTIQSQQGYYKIDDKYIEKDVKADDGALICECIIAYPQIENESQNTAIDKLNKIFSDNAAKKSEYFDSEVSPFANEDYKESKANEERIFNYHSYTDYFDITYLNEDIISVKYENYTSFNGAHPNYEYDSETYNMKTGEKVALTDVLNMNSDEIEKLTISLFTDIIENNKDMYFDDACNIIKTEAKNVNYYLTPKGITFYFNEYVIAPHSTGISEVDYDYDKNKGAFIIKLQ